MTKRVITYPAYNIRTVQAIFRALDVELECITTVKQAEKIDWFDGLILLGGTDISPYFYGESNKHSQASDNGRDAIEWIMVRRALSEKVPVMGICRGMQMLAVACGGSLYQDVQKQRITQYSHNGASHWLTSVRHPLRDRLPEMKVNSRHHQAVKTMPYGMKVLAKSPDDIIEAIWRPGLLGVQWHPEDMFLQNHKWIHLFKWFTDGLKAN